MSYKLTQKQQKIVELMAKGFCPKSNSARIIKKHSHYISHLATIRKMNGTHNSIEMLSALIIEPEEAVKGLKLTPRGKEVFLLMLAGMSDKQIGECLGISYSGVRRHKEKMLLANGCGTVLELMAKYYDTAAVVSPAKSITQR